MLKLRSGINIVNVPYKGSPFAAQDTIAGRTEIYIDSVHAMSSHLGSDRLRIMGWFALLAPSGTPYEALARVNKDLNDILALTEVSELLRRNGVFNGGGTLDEVQRFLRSERTLWQEAIQKAGIQPE